MYVSFSVPRPATFQDSAEKCDDRLSSSRRHRARLFFHLAQSHTAGFAFQIVGGKTNFFGVDRQRDGIMVC
jgi:hypothetical protein